ncbi:hypothetical protein TNCV_3952091 [Trichonephila clavipes]|uniref:Uncharacterized protein n=1 Tax=Trichonephila clavipes TaxID=2585209 RepID=A0A8X6S533_TRICX|nr:hypothetical protein TNCV_3952091 [Trichonephila clavipes]
MRILHRPNMVVMRVENSFPCEGCLIGKQHFIRKKGIRSTFSKVPLCEKQHEVHNLPVAVSGHAARETDACLVLGESSRRCNGKPRLSLLHFVYSFLIPLYMLKHILFDGWSPCCSYLTMSALSNEPVSANLWCSLAKKL